MTTVQVVNHLISYRVPILLLIILVLSMYKLVNKKTVFTVNKYFKSQHKMATGFT